MLSSYTTGLDTLEDFDAISQLIRLEEYQEAIDILMPIVESDNTNIRAYYLLIKCVWQAGSKERAIELLSFAMNIAPENVALQKTYWEIYDECQNSHSLLEIFNSFEIIVPSTMTPADAHEVKKIIMENMADVEIYSSSTLEKPLVSALVCTYNSEEFIRGCLEDLERQTIAHKTEIIVINSGSEQNEDLIIHEFLKQYSNIIYFKTKKERICTAWNRGLQLAKGKYITNTNPESRHRIDCLEVLVNALNENPNAALSYGNCYATNTPNQTFEDTHENPSGIYQWNPYSHLDLLRNCEIGPRQLWCRDIHSEIGFFSQDFDEMGDFEFWLRISEKYPAIHVEEYLGSLLEHDNSHQINNSESRYYEFCSVQHHYIDKFLKNDSIDAQGLIPIHQAELRMKIDKIKAEAGSVNNNEIELNFWSLSLLNYKLGNIVQARHICYKYLALVIISKSMSSIYRKILLEPVSPRFKFSEKPLVSIVIPLYNQGEYLEGAILSVINQNYKHWEIIVVNDGSTDNSLEVAIGIQQKYNLHPITILDQENRGKGKTRNRGVAESNGDYICVLDADDYIASTYIESSLNILLNTDRNLWVIPKTLLFGANNNNIYWTWEYDFIHSLQICPGPVTSMYSRKMWNEISGYDEQMTDREDWEFWIKAAESGWSGIVTPEVEFIYRKHIVRWGEQPEINKQSKRELIAMHSWWYKEVSEYDMEQVINWSSLGQLPIEILKDSLVSRGKIVPSKNPDFLQLVNQYKLSH